MTSRGMTVKSSEVAAEDDEDGSAIKWFGNKKGLQLQALFTSAVYRLPYCGATGEIGCAGLAIRERVSSIASVMITCTA